MAYVALYRKYRSQSFGELMGQEHVTRTLQNAIKTGHIAHAYLFYGARGCGKTSTARLLARALNCVAQDGPTPEPCGKCRLCLSIRDGICLDVTEMDAASETGIDDVREKIIENVQYAPGEARYKVYIIDEVHDLSAKAFDALLKTLEEPPPHVVFVLATTEFHKVPTTVRSRCQHYQFKRGTLHDLAAAVERVVQAEGYTAEPEAIQALARSAEGSWRDALSLLEQVLAYSESHVTAEMVHQAIGTVGTETLARVTETLARGQWDATLAIAAELMDSGKDARQLLTALSDHLRALMFLAAGAKQAALQELGADRLSLLAPQAALFDPPTLLAMLGEISKSEREIRFTNQHRWLLESTLLRLMPGNAEGEKGRKGEKEKGNREEGTGNRTEHPTPYTLHPTPLVAATPTVVPKPPIPGAVAFNGIASDVEEEDEERAESEEFVTPPAPVQERAVTTFSAPVAPAIETPRPTANGTVSSESPTDAPPAASRFADEMTLEVVQRAWSRILKLFQKVSPQGFPYLNKAEVVGLEGRTIVLAFTESFARDRIHNNTKGRAKVEDTINQALNVTGYKIRCELAGSGSEIAGGTAGQKAPRGTQGSDLGEAAPGMEMGVLLDAPATPTAAPTRIADFDTLKEAPPAPYSPTSKETNGAEKPAPSLVEPTAKSQESNAPPSNGLLAETLELFGGEVVRSERIAKDA